uniref:Uncharacterized protein n=1 Tax=Romanomermis culicivorax TaxID=13658 RepID=A0A915HH51_ROMCU
MAGVEMAGAKTARHWLTPELRVQSISDETSLSAAIGMDVVSKTHVRDSDHIDHRTRAPLESLKAHLYLPFPTKRDGSSTA